jgi:acetyl-CoA carboxylase carboxyltransferase component
MRKIISKHSSSQDYAKNNKDSHLHLLEELKEKQNLARSPESKSALEKLEKQNKLSTAERLSNLIDPDSSVLECGLLAGLDTYEGVPPGAGIYTAIACIHGQETMIIANIPSVKGGTYYPLTVKKHLRAQAIAEENNLPLVYLVDSGGAFLPLQSEVYPDRDHFGRIFFNQANISKKGIPQIACVMGLCTAGGAYVPAMSEQVIMVEGASSIFLGGPPLVKAATGEDVSAEELGGARIHTEISGVADYLAKNELEALSKVRDLFTSIGNKGGRVKIKQAQSALSPYYDPQELYEVVSPDFRQHTSSHEVLARIVDGSMFDEFKPSYGETLTCGFAHIHGYLVGLIINNGVLYGESALKGAQFIDMCDKRRIPLVFLHNIPGFMVGKEYEHAGIAKHGAKMVTAVSTATVPKYSIIFGGSFGAGNYSMCGRAFGPRFLYSWPNSKISVMSGGTAGKVLSTVKRSSDAKVTEEELSELERKTSEKYEAEGSSWFATAKLWDDGIIDPASTRDVLGLALGATSFNQDSPPEALGIFRM